MFSIFKRLASLVPTPSAGKVTVFVDEEGIPSFKDETGNVTSMVGGGGGDIGDKIIFSREEDGLSLSTQVDAEGTKIRLSADGALFNTEMAPDGISLEMTYEGGFYKTRIDPTGVNFVVPGSVSGGTVVVAAPSTDFRLLTLPDKSGTLATLDDIPAGGGVEEYGIFAIHETAIAAGGYPATRSLPRAATLNRFYAEAIDGSCTVEVLVNGVSVHGPVTVSNGSPITTTVDLPLDQGDQITFNVGSVSGVTRLWAQLSGS